MAKTPRLVNPTPHTPYKYPTLVLPPMQVLNKTTIDKALPSRIQQPAPQPQLQTPKAPMMQPGGPTNRPGVPSK